MAAAVRSWLLSMKAAARAGGSGQQLSRDRHTVPAMRAWWKDSSRGLGSHRDWRKLIAKRTADRGRVLRHSPQPGPGLSSSTARSATSRTSLTSASHKWPSNASLTSIHSGGPRHHDLVAHGALANGETVIVCVEAKAGEDLDRTVERYTRHAQNRRAKGETTNAPERIAALLKRYVPYDSAEQRVRLVRYQFLSALAGTEAEAAYAGADHAVLMLHDFITDQRCADKTSEHAVDWHRFCTTVFDCDPPGPEHLPWCIEVPAPKTMTARLYLAWAVTDLRTSTLEG